jgi:cell division protein FtsQ
MPRVSRSRKQVQDRPGRGKLLLRRGRRLLRPALWIGCGLGVVVLAVELVRTAMPGGAGGGTVASPHERFAGLSSALGWRVRDVVIEGRANTPEPLLRAAIGVSRGDPVLSFSLAEARARIETLPWIESAAVERRLPGTILVALTERHPYAVWQNQGKFALIDRTGQVLADHDVGQFQSLPLVVGTGAAEHAAELLDALLQHPALSAHMVAAVRIGDRRWNLHMQNGIDVLLPEGHAAAALQRLATLQEGHDLLGRPLQVIDLRLPDRLVVRPQPAPHPTDSNAASEGGAQGGPPHGAPASTRHPT